MVCVTYQKTFALQPIPCLHERLAYFVPENWVGWVLGDLVEEVILTNSPQANDPTAAAASNPAQMCQQHARDLFDLKCQQVVGVWTRKEDSTGRSPESSA